jgi:hypothetical protein
MYVAQAIEFTQEQARAITGVSPETLRHWRKIVPYLAMKTGKAARFTFSDLIGLAMTQQLVEAFGVGVGSLRLGIDTLFRVLAEARPLALANTVVVIDAQGASVRRSDEVSKAEFSGPVLLIPCDPVIERLRRYILSGLTADLQMSLSFPPQAVPR